MSAIRNGEQKLQALSTSGSAAAASTASTIVATPCSEQGSHAGDRALSVLLHGFAAE
jgi:hypothetical protein